MKSSPNTKAVKNMDDRPPRVVAAGKSSAMPTKGSAKFGKEQLTPKQPTGTGKAKKPQYL